jgi:thiol:disulfide interchange protein DsbC
MLRTMRPLILILMLGISAGVFLAGEAGGFEASLGGGADCSACHTLTLEEATSLITSMNPSIEVVGVAMGPVEGLWEVVIEARGKKGIAYVDFSKEHVITGSVLRVSTKENLTSLRLYALSKIDLSTIPLDEAIVMGRTDAKYKAVVFDDPD